jgi:folate-binding protein YgfZ
MIETALHAHLAAQGAVHADDRGVVLPRHFGDAEAEYRALRDGVAIYDLGFRTLVRATGEDRVSFLQGMLTNDVARLEPGHNRPALLLTIQGRVTADVRVAADGDALLLDVDVRARDAFLAALNKLLIADDVELTSVDVAMIGVTGRLPPTDAPHFVGGDLGATDTVIHARPDEAPRLWDALAGAGARPVGMDALEGRRVELVVPRIGLDMDESTLALEVPVDWAISQTKGCYLGQEVVARGTARGHVNRKLVSMTLAGPLPPVGAPLVRDGKEVGRVTTVARAFGAGTGAALGFVRRECWDPGTELAVRHGHAVTIATLA